jgi:hypothetical protein
VEHRSRHDDHRRASPLLSLPLKERGGRALDPFTDPVPKPAGGGPAGGSRFLSSSSSASRSISSDEMPPRLSVPQIVTVIELTAPHPPTSTRRSARLNRRQRDARRRADLDEVMGSGGGLIDVSAPVRFRNELDFSL